MSKSNPEHRGVINAGNTYRSEKKNEREWKELQSEKRAYIKRKQEEEDAAKQINNLKRALEEAEDDDPPF